MAGLRFEWRIPDCTPAANRHLRRLLGPDGLLLIWGPALKDGENRDGWLERFEHGSRQLWAELDASEWNAMLMHMRESDYPKPASPGMYWGWRLASDLPRPYSWYRPSSPGCIAIGLKDAGQPSASVD
jgi:hypothetical protein